MIFVDTCFRADACPRQQALGQRLHSRWWYRSTYDGKISLVYKLDQLGFVYQTVFVNNSTCLYFSISQVLYLFVLRLYISGILFVIGSHSLLWKPNYIAYVAFQIYLFIQWWILDYKPKLVFVVFFNCFEINNYCKQFNTTNICLCPLGCHPVVNPISDQD